VIALGLSRNTILSYCTVTLLETVRSSRQAKMSARSSPADRLQQLGIEPIRLRPAMLARHGDTCRVDHISLDAASSQPPRQPEAVPAGFVGHRDPIDRAACLGRFVPPAIQQLEQRRLIGRKLLQRLSVDPRNYAGDQPGRSAHLNDGNKCAILIQSGERSAQVIRLRHGAPRRLVSSDDDALSSPLAP
jgi:hypothetical protein